MEAVAGEEVAAQAEAVEHHNKTLEHFPMGSIRAEEEELREQAEDLWAEEEPELPTLRCPEHQEVPLLAEAVVLDWATGPTDPSAEASAKDWPSVEAEVALPTKIRLPFQEAVAQPVPPTHNHPIHPMDHIQEGRPIAGGDVLENFVHPEAHLSHGHFPYRVHPDDHHTDHRNHVQILFQKKN